ncbi:hypothetical protein GDO81_013360 [Engystomops pustulosus]|uniref:Uncharacterized protein n=1 Tax=Engystomops pustulosus TaxID=76066 RepID=A0AAV7B3F3_ENGPU|nr:hypothetical protein GDO81_013360 [Engystomops pustulosus]
MWYVYRGGSILALPSVMRMYLVLGSLSLAGRRLSVIILISWHPVLYVTVISYRSLPISHMDKNGGSYSVAPSSGRGMSPACH